MGKGDGDYSSLDTVSGLLFDYNIYFEDTHLENIFKIINIFLEVDLPLACVTYFRWKKGERKRGITVVWSNHCQKFPTRRTVFLLRR